MIDLDAATPAGIFLSGFRATRPRTKNCSLKHPSHAAGGLPRGWDAALDSSDIWAMAWEYIQNSRARPALWPA